MSFETLDEFVARTGVPEEGDSPGATEWIVRRMSGAQRKALEKLAANGTSSAAELNVSSGTLNSLADFRRGERDCLAPLMLVTREYYEGDRCYFWTPTKLGLRVVEAFASGMSAFGQDREAGLEAKPASPVAATSGEAPNPSHHT